MERAATETADLPRMTAEQSVRANALIRELCANFDDGCCLLLDDGYDPCPCPQLISNSFSLLTGSCAERLRDSSLAGTAVSAASP